MKKILFLATAFVLGVAAMAQQSPDEVVKLNTEKHNFGKIKQNIPVTYFFEITNKSDKAVVIENAWGSCGCTTPEVPKGPIMPGSSVKLKVQYNAATLAAFEKDVYIKIGGIDQPKIVKVSGEVLEATAYDTYVKEKSKEKPTKGGKR